MNAELALWLVEQGLDLPSAKAAAAEPQSEAGLALLLVEWGAGVGDAKALAKLAPLPAPPQNVRIRADFAEPGTPGPIEDEDAIRPARVAPRKPGDLMPHQQAALDSGIGLCPNCQQPKNNHLPLCTIATGIDSRAVTKSALPPAEA